MNIRDVLRQLNVRFSEAGASGLVTDGWIGLVCPYCDRGKGRPGLGVHVRTLKCSCWSCGGHGLARALADSSGRPLADVRALLAGVVAAPRAEPVRGRYNPPPGVGPLQEPHKRYLRGRGFDPDELVRVWGIGALGADGGQHAWRIFIPVRDDSGEPVSWTTRAIGQVSAGGRYRTARPEDAAVPKSACLFGINHVVSAVVIVEGHFGAMWGGPGFVATGGVGFSRAQVARLSQVPVRAVLFDSGTAAQRRARALAAALAPFPGVTEIVQTSGADPDTSPLAERDELRTRYFGG